MKKYLLLITVCVFLWTTGLAQAAVPEKTSKLNNWEGIRIVHGKRGPESCYLVFPDNFGYHNKDQRQILLEIIRGIPKRIKHDRGCMTPPVYYGLAHLLYLATKKQDQTAARIILRPKLYGGLNLDGELAEGHTLDRKLPVMIQFKEIKQLLLADPKLGNDTVDEIVYQLCSEWGYDPKKIRDTHQGLQNNGPPDLAERFKNKCDTEVAKQSRYSTYA